MRTKKSNKFRQAVLALGSCALALPLSAHALFITTTDTVRVDSNPTATDTSSTGGSVTGSAATGNFAAPPTFTQFNSVTGVLIGATATLATTGTFAQTRNANASGDSSLNANWNAFGTSGTAVVASFNNTTTGSTTSLATVTRALTPLNSFVGAATLASGSVAYTVTANKDSGNDNSSITGTYTRPGNNGITSTETLTYEYLLHAVPGLSALTLDFGTVTVGDVVGGLGFNVFNTFATDRVGLDLDSITPSGASTVLTTNLAGFSGLASGGSKSYQAFLDTSNAGVFSATYLLGFSDADVGASASRSAYQLTLKVTGEVQARAIEPAAVPEPASMALVALGLLGLGVFSRKRA